ncbi:indole-3-glycerol phosphate synthase TrpC [Bacillus sp. JZ8]
MLEKILQTKREELKEIQLGQQEDVQKISFYQALQNKARPVSLIAEVKKASPSKGLIKENFNPVQIAKQYVKGGANALSVLTDETYFKGHHTYLTNIKKEVSIPVLRKDFIIDSLQVEQSARIGADAILLIGEAMSPEKLYELYLQAKELHLDCLVEVHSREVLQGILTIFTPEIIGINNRNLHTFQTTLQQTEQISQFVPKESLMVSESGIFTYEDVQTVKKAGANAILVGESLMRQEDQTTAIYDLFGEEVYEN